MGFFEIKSHALKVLFHSLSKQKLVLNRKIQTKHLYSLRGYNTVGGHSWGVEKHCSLRAKKDLTFFDCDAKNGWGVRN